MGKSILKEKSFEFAVKVVHFTRSMQTDQKEFVLSRQLLKSGTAIGALIREAEYGQSAADFKNKMYIALKEVNETEYWLQLLDATGLIESRFFAALLSDCCEIKAMLIATIKTLRRNEKER
jgi:four helix bundle protein